MLTNLRLMLTGVAITAFCANAGAQMVVHAMSGTVKSINPASKTMDVTESGDTNEFNLPSGAKVSLDFDNALRSDSTEPSQFQKVGDYALVYYYGYDSNRTAVAVKDLGAGPFAKLDGTVVGFDKHSRTVTLKDDAGKANSFELSNHLVVDTGISVESGRGYDPHKGSHIRVTYTKSGDKNTAVFVRSLQ